MGPDQTDKPYSGGPPPEGDFRVEDRRRFDPETGETRSPEGIGLPGGGVLQREQPGSTAALPVDFAELVRPFLLMGLASLGVLPHPETQQPQVDLTAARMAIDLLDLLRARTEGHRSAEETRLLDEALFELRMQFLEVSERRSGS